MNVEYLVGIIAVSMTLSAFGYQLFKVVRTKETKALSYNLMIWIGLAMALYVVFGYYFLNEPIIYVGNAIGVLLNIGLLYYKWKNEQ